MTDIILTKEQFSRLPYRDTEINRAKSYGEIIGLLEGHGIRDYQFTKYQGTDVLAFPVKVRRGEVDYSLMVKLTVPRLMYYKAKGRGKPDLTYLEKESWRIFWWFLKSKLEAIEFGISDEVREFMANISHALPDGREVNLGEMVLGNMDRLDKLALPGPSEWRRVVEAEAKEGSR